MVMGNYIMHRSNLGQYSSPNPWSSFITDVIGRAGRPPEGLALRRAQADLWQDQLTNARSRAATKIRISSLLENDAIRTGFEKRAAELNQKLNTYPKMITALTEIGPSGELLFPESGLMKSYINFDELREKINELGHAMQGLEKSAPLLSTSAKQLADEARAQMTPEQISQLKSQAGGDDLYFAQLKNQLFLTKLAELHARELGPDIMADINRQIEDNERYLEEAKPTIVSQALESDALDTALNIAKDARLNIPDIGGMGKWAIMIGTGAAALGVGAVVWVIRAIARGARKEA